MDVAIAGVIATIVAFRVIGMTTGRHPADPLDRSKFLSHLAVLLVLFAYCIISGFISFSRANSRDRENRLLDLARKTEMLLQAGQLDDASGTAAKDLALAEELYGPKDPRVSPYLDRYARCLSHEKKYAEAEALTQRALDIAVKQFGEDHESVALQENNLGAIYADMGQLDRAEALYRRALAKTERITGQIPPVLPAILGNLAGLCERTGRAEEAQRLKKRIQGFRPSR